MDSSYPAADSRRNDAAPAARAVSGRGRAPHFPTITSVDSMIATDTMQLGAPCVHALTDRYRDAQVRAAAVTTGP